MESIIVITSEAKYWAGLHHATLNSFHLETKSQRQNCNIRTNNTFDYERPKLDNETENWP